MRDLTHLLPRAAVESLIELADGQGHQDFVVHQIVLGAAAVAV